MKHISRESRVGEGYLFNRACVNEREMENTHYTGLLLGFASGKY